MVPEYPPKSFGVSVMSEPYSSLWLYFAIIVDNLASGLAGAAFIAFLSSLTSVTDYGT
jgi:hypothetical protein